MTLEPHTLSWVNPTQDTATPPNPFDPATIAGYQIAFDGGAPFALPLTAAATSFDMSTLPQYQALARGKHTVTIDVIDNAGFISGLSNPPASFLIGFAPMAPSAVAVS